VRAGCRARRRVVRDRRHPLAPPARRGRDARVRREDGPGRDRARGSAHRRLRRRARSARRRARDLRPPGARSARDRLRRSVPVLDDRGRVHAVRRARRGRRTIAPLTGRNRLRLWLERDRRGAGYHLRDAATGDSVPWDDPRVRVVAVAGVSFRGDAVADASFDPGERLALVREPENEHDPNAVAIWNEARTLQAGYVPREVAAELEGDELAVSLWRAGEAGLRVLLVPAGSWVGRPRRKVPATWRTSSSFRISAR